METDNKLIDKLFKTMKNTLVNLYGRWLDEKEYEDFADYETVMREKFDSIPPEYGLRFVKGTKRPFGFIFDWRGKQMQFSVTTREMRITAVKTKGAKVA